MSEKCKGERREGGEEILPAATQRRRGMETITTKVLGSRKVIKKKRKIKDYKEGRRKLEWKTTWNKHCGALFNLISSPDDNIVCVANVYI